jgi:hypothetical protein
MSPPMVNTRVRQVLYTEMYALNVNINKWKCTLYIAQ